jgi:hypothetical protein
MPTPLEQLPKLLRMLESPNDHEVVVAARKIHAAMISNGWNWDQLLANGSGLSLTEDQMHKIFAAGVRQGEVQGYQRGMADAQAMPTTPKGPSVEIADDLSWVGPVLDASEKAGPNGHLDAFETDFSDSMRAKIQRFGKNTYLSQKQFDSLKRLEKSLRRRGYL